MAKIRDIQASADHGRVLVDEQLQDLEARLTDLYAKTSREAKKDLDAFLGKFAEKDKEKRAQVASGEITQEEYIDWRNRTIFRTEAMTAKVNDLTQQMLHADQTAMAMLNEQLPEVYATSWNFAGYRGETFAEAAGFDYTQFTIVNRDAVRILATKDPDLIPWKPEVDIPKDERWNRQHLQTAILQGIVKGDSIPDISDRLMPVVNMDRTAAVRTARTAVTGVENKGRKDATERVKEAGIPMVEAWSCTHDARTRDTHILMDGTLPNDAGFYGEGIVEGNLLEYPADPNGEPSEVYNCRCSIVSTIKGIDHSKDDELYAKMMESEYYEDWLDVKEQREEKEAQFQAKRELALEKRAAEPYTNEPVAVKSFTESEKIELMEHYISGEGYSMNKYARGEEVDDVEYTKEEIAQMTEDFEKLLKEERLPEETHVYRGTSYDSLLESTGLSLQEIIENPKAIVGETITERGFVSTTSDYSMANDYAGGRVLYSITLPEGAEAVDQNEVLGYLTEKEITVQRDSQYVITNAHVSFFDADGNPYPNGGYLHISMEYVGVRGEGQEPQTVPEPEPKKNEQEEILLANKDSELPDDKIIEITEAVEENATIPEPFETRKFDGAKDAVEYFRGSTRPSMVGAYRDHGFSVAEDPKKPATQWASKLTRDQSSAIFGYTRSGYMPVNGYLRGEIDKKGTKEMIVAGIDSTSGWSVDKYVKTLDAAIGKFDLKEPITVYRTCEREFLDKLEIGGTFHDEGFGSTSVLSVPVASGDVHLTIDVPAGKGVGAFIDGESSYEGEEFEFLLARGADYYIKDIRYTDEGVFIDAVITGFTK